MTKKMYGFLFLTAAVVAVVFIFHHAPGRHKYYPPCIFKKLTGGDCAGCGSARACYQLLHGNILKAADHNILLLVLLPVMGIGIMHFFTGRLTGAWNKINKPFVFLIVIISFWIIRNIPLFPFTILHSDW